MPASSAAPLAVALDYGGTLTREAAHVDGVLVSAVLADQYGVEVPEGFPAAFDSAYRGRLPDALLVTAARTGVELPDDLAAPAEAVQQEPTERGVDPRAAQVVHELHQRGHRLVLAANTSRSHTERCATLTAAGIGHCFTAVILSSELAVAKPDERFYRAVAEAAGWPPARVWFVGDRLTNDVHGPRAFGMPAVLIDRHGHVAQAPDNVPVLTHIDQLPALVDKENHYL